jgi:hypothetical protein
MVLAKMRSPTDRVGTGSELAGCSDGAGAADGAGSGGGAGVVAGSNGGGGDGVVAAAGGAAAVASFGGAARPPQPEANIAAAMSAVRKLRGPQSVTQSSNAPFM